MFVIDTVRLHESGVLEVTFLGEYGIFPLVTGVVIDTYGAGVAARSMIFQVHVLLKGVIHVCQDQSLVEQGDCGVTCYKLGKHEGAGLNNAVNHMYHTVLHGFVHPHEP